ncbi:MAG TPA: hypothetical protein V6D07_18880 [Trichocoleus sp.]
MLTKDLAKELALPLDVLNQIISKLGGDPKQPLAPEMEEVTRNVCAYMSQSGNANIDAAIAACLEPLMEPEKAQADAFNFVNLADSNLQAQINQVRHDAMVRDILFQKAQVEAAEELLADALTFLNTPPEDRQKFLQDKPPEYQSLVRFKAMLLSRQQKVSQVERGFGISPNPGLTLFPSFTNSLNGSNVRQLAGGN